MFKKLECVSIHTKDIEKSVSFYKEMGMEQNWVIERELEEGVIWTLIGLKFPDEKKFGVSNKQSSGYSFYGSRSISRRCATNV